MHRFELTPLQQVLNAVHMLEGEAASIEDELEAEDLWRAARILRDRYSLGLDDLRH